jgi:hypothetical protein
MLLLCKLLSSPCANTLTNVVGIIHAPTTIKANARIDEITIVE